MTRDRNDVEELAHDSAGLNVEPFLERALVEVVEDIMVGLKVGGFTLQAFLAEQPDLAEEVAAAIINHDRTMLEHEIERRLRRELEGSDVVSDRAYELATEGEE